MTREPTRITRISATLIDLIFVSCPELVSLVGVLPAFCSDHCAVYINPKLNVTTRVIFPLTVYDCNKIDIPTLRCSTSQINWDEIIQENDDDSSVRNFPHIITNLYEEHVPHKQVQILPSNAPWMNDNIRRLMRKRNRAHKTAKRRNVPCDWEKCIPARNTVISAVCMQC